MAYTFEDFRDRVEGRLRKLLRKETVRTRNGEKRIDAAYANQLAAQMVGSTYTSTMRRLASEGWDADGAAHRLIELRNSGRQG